MDFPQLRIRALRIFIAFLGITAAMAAFTVLVGSFGDFEIKVLLSTLTVTAASVCAMASAAYVEHRKNVRIGQASMVLTVAGALLLIGGMWGEPNSELYWRTTAILATWAGFTAHILLLRIPELPAKQGWIQSASTITVAVLAIMIAWVIAFEHGDEWFMRLMAVFGILVGLVTIVIPILVKLRGELSNPGTEGSEVPAHLVLEHIEGDLYSDCNGTHYSVRPVSSPTEN